MEEILASIRRIISEDDAPAETAPAAAAPQPEPEPEPAPQPEPEPEPEPAEDVLELTERYEAPAEEPVEEQPVPTSAQETLGDLDIGSADPFPVDEAAPEPEPAPAPRAAPSSDEALVSDATAASAAGAFAGLAAALRRRTVAVASSWRRSRFRRRAKTPLLRAERCEQRRQQRDHR